MTTYNGWTNWDTWNMNLWLNNDEATYQFAMDCRDALTLKIDCELMYPRGLDGIDFKAVNWNEIYNGLHA